MTRGTNPMLASKRGPDAIGHGDRERYPASPCVSICTLDEAEICLGCGRTLREIACWSTYSKEQQWQIIDDLSRRDAANPRRVNRPLQET